MRFENHTPLPAAVVPSSDSEDRIHLVVVAALTCQIVDGALVPAAAQRPLALAQGPLPNDRMFQKEGASVCATGFVYPKEGEARAATAKLTVGEREAVIAAFGVRVWQKSTLGGGLAPSAPRPFKRIEMTWTHAFGGSVLVPSAMCEVDGEEALMPEHEEAYPQNFDGTGFYPTAARALHQPLPQLEHPEQLVRRWDDRPEPVCFAPYPVYGALRATAIVREGPSGPELALNHAGRLANRAAPRTTFDAVAPGSRIVLKGMRPGGALLAFTTPSAPVRVDVGVGGREALIEPVLDAVDIDAEAAEVRLCYRAIVVYDLVQFEERRLVVEPAPEFRWS